MGLWRDETVWIVFIAVLCGALTVYILTGDVGATGASALAGLFALAMLYDSVERRTASPSAPVYGPTNLASGEASSRMMTSSAE